MSVLDENEKRREKQLIQKAMLLKTRKERDITFNASALGVYGWHVSLPVLLGVILGRFLDTHLPLPPMSWTLNMILIGFMAGVFNANRWLKKEGVLKNTNNRIKETKKRLSAPRKKDEK